MVAIKEIKDGALELFTCFVHIAAREILPLSLILHKISVQLKKEVTPSDCQVRVV